MKKNISQKTADAILQKSKKVTLGGVEYELAPPSLATLTEVSSLIARVPEISLDPDKATLEVLRIAKYCDVLGDIIAVLILGATTNPFNKQRGLFSYKKSYMKIYEEVKQRAMYLTPPSEAFKVVLTALDTKEIPDFFLLTTSLSEVNILRETREVV